MKGLPARRNGVLEAPRCAHNAAYVNFAPLRTPGGGDRSEFSGKTMTDETLTYTMWFGGTLELRPEGIRYKGETHQYSTVTHLGRYASRTSFNFIPVIDFLRLRIHIQGREKPITVQNGIGLVFTTSSLQKIYERLVEKTFQHRVRAYLKQLETKGFFEYGGARFFSSGEVEMKNHKYDLRTSKLGLEPFHLVLKDPSFFAIKRKISADIDKDVFLTLLKKLWGISFKD